MANTPDDKWGHLHGMTIDGDDIVFRRVRATRFGGKDDGEDNGVGASGFNTSEHPEYMGCSLPSFRPASVLDGLFADCPIPKLPWKTTVRVFCNATGKTVYAHLIDLGPHPKTETAIDLTNATVEALGLSLKTGVYTVDFRIIDGAKFIKKSES